MQHLTLNTGHRRESPRHEVGDLAIAALRPLLRQGGGHLPGFAHDYELEISRQPGNRDVLFTIWWADAPVLTGALARQDPIGCWQLLQALAAHLDVPVAHVTPPEATPWLAVLIMITATQVPPDDLLALADFERCLAWTIIEEDACPATC